LGHKPEYDPHVGCCELLKLRAGQHSFTVLYLSKLIINYSCSSLTLYVHNWESLVGNR